MKRVVKWVGIILLFLVLIFSAIILFLQFEQPGFVSAGRLSSFLSQTLNTKVRIESTDLDGIDRLNVRGIYIEDRNGDTLLFSEKAYFDLNLKDLLSRSVTFEKIALTNSYLQAQRKSGEVQFNYERILEDYVSEDSTASPWNVKFNDIQLSDTRVDFRDIPSGLIMQAKSDFIQTEIEELVSEDGVTTINSLLANNFRYKVLKQEEESDLSQPVEEGSADPFKIILREVRLTKSYFAFEDQTEPSAENGIDWSHLEIFEINSNLHDLVISDSLFKGNIDNLSLREKSGFVLTNISGTAHAELPSLKVKIDSLITPETNLIGAIALYFPDLNRFADTLGDISTNTTFKNGRLSIKDVSYFWPPIDTIDVLTGETLALSGQIEGKVKEFAATNFFAGWDDDNMFHGNIQLSGLPDIKNLIVDLYVDTLVVSNETIASLTQEKPDQVNLKALGKMRMEGVVAGSLDKLDIDAAIYSSQGMARAKGDLAFSEEFDLLRFSTSVATRDLNVGTVFGIEQMGKVSAKLNARGTAKDVSSFAGHIEEMQFNGYSYSGLNIKGSYLNDKLQATLNARDQNFKGDIQVAANILSAPVLYSVSGYFDTLDLEALNFSEEPFSLEGYVEAELQGFDPDSIEGVAYIEGIRMVRGKDLYVVDSLRLKSEITGRERLISAQSGNFNMSVEGTFKPSRLPDAAQHFLSHYHSQFESPGKIHPEDLDFTLKIEDAEGLIASVLPDLDELDSLFVNAAWNSETHTLVLEASSNAFTYSGTKITALDVKIEADREDLEFGVNAKDLILPGQIRFEKPKIAGTMKDDVVSFRTAFSDTSKQTFINLEGLLSYRRDSFYLTMPDAQVVLKGNEWNLEDEAMLVLSEDYFRVQDFVFTADPDQMIAINSGQGILKQADIVARVRNIRISELSSLFGMDYKLQGNLSGEGRISGLPDEPGILAELDIKQLMVDTMHLGNLTAEVEKKKGDTQMHLQALINGAKPKAEITGTVNTGEVMNLDLQADLDNLSLSILQPFVKDFAYALAGDITAKLDVGGTVEKPVITGFVRFPYESMVGLNATQTEYYFENEEIIINNQQINFGDFEITDVEGNKALVKGEIAHTNLEKFQFDVSVTGEDFLFMDNPKSEELPVYGTLYADLNATIKGPVDNLNIEFRVESSEGSEIVMSLLPAAIEYATPTYINFVTPDSLIEEEKVEQAQYSLNYPALKMHGDVILTEKAQIEVIVDPVNGDRITGRGKGELKVGFDAENNLSLAGTYELTQGNYTFTFLNLVKRSFKILEGSTISWYGDPEEGIMDVTATYSTEASRYPLVKDQMEDLPAGELRAAQKELPVTVYLFLQGDIEQPDLTFNIEVPEGTDALSTSIVAQRLIEIKNTPSELNKQVMGLIAFNQFFPYQGFDIEPGGGGAGAIAAQSVTQFLNKQLGVVTDQLGGIELDVSVEPGNQLDLEALNVSASKDISDRLTVSVGGNVPLADRGEEYSSSFLGDYRVYYRLNETGTVKLKVFSRSERDIYTDYVQQISGFSLHHHRNADHVKELFMR